MTALFTIVVGATLSMAGSATEQEPAAEQAQAVQEQKADEKVCKYVALGMDSRRKEKVCLTPREWKEFKSPR